MDCLAKGTWGGNADPVQRVASRRHALRVKRHGEFPDKANVTPVDQNQEKKSLIIVGIIRRGLIRGWHGINGCLRLNIRRIAPDGKEKTEGDRVDGGLVCHDCPLGCV
jgi:hypothetical protein